MPVQHLSKEAARRDARAVNLHFVARAEAEVNEQLEAFAVAGVAYGLVVEFPHAPRESFGQGGGSAGSLERLHPTEGRGEVERLRFGHGFDLDDVAAAYDARSLDVLVNESLDGEDDLVVERRLRILRQSADA